VRPHLPTLWAGVLFVAVGVAFSLEAAGVWTFVPAHLRIVGPLALVALGLGLLLGTERRAP